MFDGASELTWLNSEIIGVVESVWQSEHKIAFFKSEALLTGVG